MRQEKDEREKDKVKREEGIQRLRKLLYESFSTIKCPDEKEKGKNYSRTAS